MRDNPWPSLPRGLQHARRSLRALVANAKRGGSSSTTPSPAPSPAVSRPRSLSLAPRPIRATTPTPSPVDGGAVATPTPRAGTRTTSSPSATMLPPQRPARRMPVVHSAKNYPEHLNPFRDDLEEEDAAVGPPPLPGMDDDVELRPTQDKFGTWTVPRRRSHLNFDTWSSRSSKEYPLVASTPPGTRAQNGSAAPPRPPVGPRLGVASSSAAAAASPGGPRPPVKPRKKRKAPPPPPPSAQQRSSLSSAVSLPQLSQAAADAEVSDQQTVPLSLSQASLASGGEHTAAGRPVQDHSGGDQPVQDHSGGDQPVQDHSGGDQPVQDHSGGDQPVQDQSGGDQPVQDHSGGDQSVQDHSTEDHPFEEQSAVDHPADEADVLDPPPRPVTENGVSLWSSREPSLASGTDYTVDTRPSGTDYTVDTRASGTDYTVDTRASRTPTPTQDISLEQSGRSDAPRQDNAEDADSTGPDHDRGKGSAEMSNGTTDQLANGVTQEQVQPRSPRASPLPSPAASPRGSPIRSGSSSARSSPEPPLPPPPPATSSNGSPLRDATPSPSQGCQERLSPENEDCPSPPPPYSPIRTDASPAVSSPSPPLPPPPAIHASPPESRSPKEPQTQATGHGRHCPLALPEDEDEEGSIANGVSPLLTASSHSPVQV